MVNSKRPNTTNQLIQFAKHNNVQTVQQKRPDVRRNGWHAPWPNVSKYRTPPTLSEWLAWLCMKPSLRGMVACRPSRHSVVCEILRVVSDRRMRETLRIGAARRRAILSINSLRALCKNARVPISNLNYPQKRCAPSWRSSDSLNSFIVSLRRGVVAGTAPRTRQGSRKYPDYCTDSSSLLSAMILREMLRKAYPFPL